MDINEILERLDVTLAQAWRNFLASEAGRPADAFGSGTGTFRGGVDACATQLERTLAKIREEIANG